MTETRLLLALIEGDGYQRIFIGSFYCQPLGEKVPLPGLLTVCCPNWMSRTQRKATVKLCQDKVGKSFKIPASQKSLPNILSLQVEDGCSSIVGTLGDCLGSQISLSFLYFWKLFALHLLFTRVIFILLRSLMVLKSRLLYFNSFSCYQIQKRNLQKRCKVYRS